NSSTYSPYWTKGVAHHWLIRNGTDSTARSYYLKRIIVDNLDLDGNFSGQGAWTSEANATGYKSFALDLAAESGWIKNVTVRNFGSVGDVPASSLHNPTGVEAFPLRFRTFDVTATGQALADPTSPSPPNNFPWIVEDVDVCDFKSVHGGYGTMIMPIVYQQTRGTILDPPVAVIRRCQVRVNEAAIALGTAGADHYPFNSVENLPGVISGRIRYQDNVVVGAGIGFNTDTDSIGPLVFENNAFLDVGYWGFVGQADSGVNHNGYLLKDNLIRLRGRFHMKSWSDVCLSTYPNIATDPNLALGRYVPDDVFCAGLVIQGAAANVTMEGNDFTTWPVNNFYLARPSDTIQAKYRIVWKLPSDQNINCWLYSRSRPALQSMTFGPSADRLSTRTYDFGGHIGLATGVEASFVDPAALTYSGSSWSFDHLAERSALASTGFTPKGRLGRVLPLFAPPVLTKVREVQIGEVTYSAGTLTVQTRVADHFLRAGGANPVVKTFPLAGVKPLLRVVRRDENSLVSSTDHLGLMPSDINGLVTFQVPGLGGASGVCQLSAWLDGAGGVAGAFEPEYDCWANYDFPLANASGKPVVEMSATPDVGDDKNTTPSKRAVIIVKRNLWAGSMELPVKVAFRSGVFFRPPSSSQDLAATYGTTGSADYYINALVGSWTPPNASGIGTIRIPSNQEEARVQIVTRADNLTEQNIIVCQLEPDASAYALGVSTAVKILIYDGPLWTIQELTGSDVITTTTGAGAAVNSGIVSAGTWTVTPQVAGTSRWSSLLHGALWSAPGFTPVNDFGLTFRPYGISFRLSVGQHAKVVGAFGDSAYITLDDSSGATALPHIPGTTGPSLAWGISPNGTWTVGYSSTVAGTGLPAKWTGVGTPVDLSSTFAYPTRTGEAKAVNDAGVIVGSSSGFTAGAATVQRPFRNAGGGLALSQLDWLAVPGGGGVGTANAIATVGPNHYAAGWYKLNDVNLKVGVLWRPPAGATLPSQPIDLGRLQRVLPTGRWREDTQSEAKGISPYSTLMIVGWSGPSESDPNRRAVFHTGTQWKDLNDAHFTHGTGWVLRSANAIGDTGVVAGEGTANGVSRGFLLIPRIPEN
ncbi:MAG TPA: hypothetical protein DCE44_20075, partial [Verrucomicrobiales bacterium]|nr:hypothetical protein [Verrucomicrobiales bacterium]